MKKLIFQNENWIDHALTRNIETVISEKELRARIAAKKQLRIKFGVDVTNPLIHLGHAVNLWKMREFQEHGHKVIFLIGDFTSLIGDPTGRSKLRPERSRAEIENFAKEYVSQVTKILIDDPSVFEVRRNSEWYDSMKLDEFLKLCARITHGRLIQRDMFQKRISDGNEIYMHEMLYPVLQGYDSYMLQSDLTVIGNDQLFNELVGRHYQEAFGQAPQIVMTTVITPGIDGKEKQSKSLGNFIAITDAPEEKFGKIMSMPDDLIGLYYEVYTFIDRKKTDQYKKDLLEGTNPRDIKIKLAQDIVELYHDKVAAEKAREQFIKIFSQKKPPADLAAHMVGKDEPWDNFLVNAKFVQSKSEAKRLINAGGVDLDGEKIKPGDVVVKGGVLRVGKKHFVKIIVK